MSVVVSPVRSRADLREFIELPFRLHSTSRQWVPPLRIERHAFLSRRQNAFFTHGDARPFLARRAGRVVGRISAQIDHAFNAAHGNDWGMFGFLGVKPEYQHTGVAAALYVEHFDVSAVSRIKWGEMGWILETNRAMNRGMEAMNGRIVKRYRVYEKALGEDRPTER